MNFFNCCIPHPSYKKTMIRKIPLQPYFRIVFHPSQPVSLIQISIVGSYIDISTINLALSSSDLWWLGGAYSALYNPSILQIVGKLMTTPNLSWRFVCSYNYQVDSISFTEDSFVHCSLRGFRKPRPLSNLRERV